MPISQRAHTGPRFVAALVSAIATLAGAGRAQAEARPVWGIEWNSPQRAAASFGLLLGDAHGDGFDLGRNLWLVQVQPGIGGGRVSVGFAPFAAGSSGLVFAGVAVKATLLRTWGSPTGAPPDHTYAGAQVDVAWVVKGSIGVLKRVSGARGSHTVVTWSVGFGL